MQIFLCYASEDGSTAEQVALALIGGGFDVFYDKSSLPAGGDFHDRINAAIQKADAFIFLASATSVRSGAYTLSELKFAREKWPHPGGRLLPVRLPGVSFEDLPAYLKSVTVLEPEGNVAAEVLAAVKAIKLSPLARSTNRRPLMLGGAALLALGGVALWVAQRRETDAPVPVLENPAVPGPTKTVFNPATAAGSVAPKPKPPKPPSAPRDGEPLMKRLEKMNVSQSVGREKMVTWLADPDRRYAHLAEACLAALAGRPLRGLPAQLDVVMDEYVHLIGLNSGTELPVAPPINKQHLETALLEAYNVRNHASAKNLEEATAR